MRNFALAAGLLLSSTGFSSNIAVIDSGLDYQHSELKDLIWENSGEVFGNRIDDDENGLVDDIRGWNFANNHSILIEYADDQSYRPDISKFLDIQSRSLLGTATKGEQKWAQEILSDSEFIKSINTYLNYAHGTHVAGIMTKNLNDVKVIDIRIIPGKENAEEEELRKKVVTALADGEEINFIAEFIFKAGLKYMAYQNAKSFAAIASYLDQQNTMVANASVGMGMAQAQGIVSPILTLLNRGKAPSIDQINEYANFFLKQSVMEQKKAFANAPNTLFIFASGNDGMDNDQSPTVPASVRLDNTISVGASIGNRDSAPFSNYGALSVDVFAPGVGILSIAPMDRELAMSGTSQAAPYVANIATQIRIINPELSPLEVKGIIMGTVDRKGYLGGKAYTEGVVNLMRATKAAELSLEVSIREAIKLSKAEIADNIEEIPDVDLPILIGKPVLPSFR